MRAASSAIALIALAMLGPYGIANGAAAASGAVAFSPSVSVAISDDAPGSHPDITTTIEASTGAFLSTVRVLTPAGGGIASDGDIYDNVGVGWITGFTTIPAGDGTCSQRYTFEVPLEKETADARGFPPFLQQLAPGPHRIRFAADVAGTPVNIIVDDVQVGGEARLQTTTYIGDPAHLAPNCAPYRSRVILDGTAGTFPPVTTAPPTPGPRVYDFTLTSRDGQIVERTVTAAVQPGLRPGLDGDALRWDAVPGVATYKTRGDIFYATDCELTRRLVIRQDSRRFFTQAGGDATSVPLPASPGPEYEVVGSTADVSAYDAEGVLLAREPLRYTRDFASCWYAPGQEPLLSVEPESGGCTGSVTFHGSRFPAGVNVEITMPPYGGDAPGERVAVAPVAPDGTFSVVAALPARSCYIASFYPEERMVFFTYNADEPKGLTVFAGARYTAAVPPGTRVTAAPNTGSGPVRRSRGYPWWLIAAGATCLAAGVAATVVDKRRNGPRESRSRI
jgi:hypothetical protein